jgi:hypothetical protein
VKLFSELVTGSTNPGRIDDCRFLESFAALTLPAGLC